MESSTEEKLVTDNYEDEETEPLDKDKYIVLEPVDVFDPGGSLDVESKPLVKGETDEVDERSDSDNKEDKKKTEEKDDEDKDECGEMKTEKGFISLPSPLCLLCRPVRDPGGQQVSPCLQSSAFHHPQPPSQSWSSQFHTQNIGPAMDK